MSISPACTIHRQCYFTKQRVVRLSFPYAVILYTEIILNKLLLKNII